MYDSLKDKRLDDDLLKEKSFADRINESRSKKIHPVIISILMRTIIGNTNKPNARVLRLNSSLEFAERKWAKAHYDRYEKLLDVATKAWGRIRDQYGDKGIRTDTAVLLNALYLNNPNGMVGVLKIKKTQINRIMDAYVNNGGGELEPRSNKAIDALVDFTMKEMENASL